MREVVRHGRGDVRAGRPVAVRPRRARGRGRRGSRRPCSRSCRRRPAPGAERIRAARGAPNCCASATPVRRLVSHRRHPRRPRSPWRSRCPACAHDPDRDRGGEHRWPWRLGRGYCTYPPQTALQRTRTGRTVPIRSGPRSRRARGSGARCSRTWRSRPGAGAPSRRPSRSCSRSSRCPPSRPRASRRRRSGTRLARLRHRSRPWRTRRRRSPARRASAAASPASQSPAGRRAPAVATAVAGRRRDHRSQRRSGHRRRGRPAHRDRADPDQAGNAPRHAAQRRAARQAGQARRRTPAGTTSGSRRSG